MLVFQSDMPGNSVVTIPVKMTKNLERSEYASYYLSITDLFYEL
jgi:hypothetical protein